MINDDFLGLLALIGAALLGGGLALILRGRYPDSVRWWLNLSGAYLLGLALVHLIPELLTARYPNLGLWIFGGFLLQLLLDRFTGGLEHGHTHLSLQLNGTISLFIGLCLHAFLEGLPLGGYKELAVDHSHHFGHTFLIGLLIHKVPAAFALTALLAASGFRKIVIISALAIFTLMAPTAAILGEWLQLPTLWNARLTAVVAGSFLHIAATIIFEADSPNHLRFSFHKLSAIIIGFILSLFGLH